MSDRGQIYIKFGPPDQNESLNPGPPLFPHERWLYRHIEGVGQDVSMYFVDTQNNNGYHMTWDPAEIDSRTAPTRGAQPAR